MPRLGRPAAANAQETRQRILDSARKLFADKGYDGTSNRALADAVGLTTGALYHYFDRKLDLYLEVYEDTQRHVYDNLEAATAGEDTFIDSLRGVLEAAHGLNNDDPSLAQFLGSCRVDVQRHGELGEVFATLDHTRQNDFFAGLVRLGVKTGELDAGDGARTAALLRTVTIGLVDGVSSSQARHREAVDGIIQLFEGKLVRPPAT